MTLLGVQIVVHGRGFTESALRYRWRKMLDKRDAEIDSLGEIVVLAQSIDNGAYSRRKSIEDAVGAASNVVRRAARLGEFTIWE